MALLDERLGTIALAIPSLLKVQACRLPKLAHAKPWNCGVQKGFDDFIIQMKELHMASRVVTQLISDLSGTEIQDGAGESIAFAYRGQSFQIDLTSKEAAAFDQVMATYVEHATKVASSRSGRKPPRGQSDAPAIRAWAKENGIDVPGRGRIPADVRARYEAAS